MSSPIDNVHEKMLVIGIYHYDKSRYFPAKNIMPGALGKIRNEQTQLYTIRIIDSVSYRSESPACAGPEPKARDRSRTGRRNRRNELPSVRKTLFP